ncbi:transglycosylase domain-containing protein [Candidatus Soleaferrea massiliensis]|uniref:transglycosylase domain-containing protein n=1 Tax=Candidatus Soleaferrea massiliensis TaxID=1470354 RepID=UPI00069429E7|nr:transglycosylase domain-containing protein [Candidatus Soleaferrea massiliensis]
MRKKTTYRDSDYSDYGGFSGGSDGGFDDINYGGPDGGSGGPEEDPLPVKPAKKSTAKKVFSNIGKGILVCFLIGIITGCIVISVCSIYLVNFIKSDEQIDLGKLKLNYTTILYVNNAETGEPQEYKRLYSSENRIWVDIDKIPEITQKAVIAAEDERFEQHHGVDWKRTLAASVNLIFPIYETQQGGSTITQQLIKNITGDDATRPDRKIREIFRALDLEKRYSKDQIMEAYLNTIFFANQTNGIQAAANLYFNKDASDLTAAESAAIIAITQAPTYYNPFENPENNRERQEYILDKMHELNFLDDQEYKDALAEEMVFNKKGAQQQLSTTQNYFVDHVINEVINDLEEELGYSESYATNQVYGGGLKIYMTMDTRVQGILEECFMDEDTFPEMRNDVQPQAAMAICDPNGKLVAIVGGRGEKEGARVLNRASQSVRQPGSAIKPIAIYDLAIEKNLIHYSSLLDDNPIMMNGQPWPVNYYGKYYGPITAQRALEISNNTIPVKLAQQLDPSVCFDFLHDKLNIKSLIDNKVIDGSAYTDKTLSGMALGGLTEGLTVLELTTAYQIFLNGGNFTPSYSYTKVLNNDGDTLLEPNTEPTRVLSEDTATIMNKLLQRVTNGPEGTGGYASRLNMPTAGKTGSTTDDKDLWFVGLTPYYVGAVWLGYDNPEQIYYNTYPTPIIWYNVMSRILEGYEYKNFEEFGSVAVRQYCQESGQLATESCPDVRTGYYRYSYMPDEECKIHSGKGSQSTSESSSSGTTSNLDPSRPEPPEPSDSTSSEESSSSETSSDTSSDETSSSESSSQQPKPPNEH